MLNLAFYPYFTMNWWTIYDFPVKKEPDIPAHSCRRNAGHKMHAAGLLGQLFFEENSKWWTKMVRSLDNSSNNLLAHTRIFTRLTLISILVRFPLGADPELKKYLSWRMLEKT